MSKGCKMKWEGDAALGKIERVALEVLWLAGQDMVTQATNEVPLDTGTLRRSGVVTVDSPPQAATVFAEAQKGKGNKSKSAKDKESPAPAAKNAKRPCVVVSYNTPYAIKLHETLWTPRNWKYSSWKRSKRKDALSRSVKLDDNDEVLYLEKIPKPAVGRNKWIERAIPKIGERMRSGVYLRRAKKKVGL